MVFRPEADTTLAHGFSHGAYTQHAKKAGGRHNFCSLNDRNVIVVRYLNRRNSWTVCQCICVAYFCEPMGDSPGY